MDQQQPQGAPPRFNRAWLIVMVILVIWNLWMFWPGGSSAVTIPYSTFVDQVRADNVDKVEIVGDQISGTFVQLLLWPPAPATPSGDTSTPAVATPSPAAASQDSASYTLFNSTFPETVGDTTLIPLLEEHNVEVNASSPPTPWLSILLNDALPIVLLVLVMLWMGRQAARSQGGILGFGRSRPRVHLGEHPEVTFEDVAGADEAKLELREVVDFLRNPQKYHELGARIPRGVLLVGSPGTGKTLMARAVAGEAGVSFFNISASEFVEMFVGVGASRVRDLFEQAKAAAPAIVFIDELDAVGRRRGAGLGAVNDEREQTLNQLLVEMDGFDERLEVIVLAATNRPDVLDPALLRPGRFDREVVVALPDQKGREGILRIHTRHLSLATDADLGLLARATTCLMCSPACGRCWRKRRRATPPTSYTAPAASRPPRTRSAVGPGRYQMDWAACACRPMRTWPSTGCSTLRPTACPSANKAPLMRRLASPVSRWTTMTCCTCGLGSMRRTWQRLPDRTR